MGNGFIMEANFIINYKIGYIILYAKLIIIT